MNRNILLGLLGVFVSFAQLSCGEPGLEIREGVDQVDGMAELRRVQLIRAREILSDGTPLDYREMPSAEFETLFKNECRYQFVMHKGLDGARITRRALGPAECGRNSHVGVA